MNHPLTVEMLVHAIRGASDLGELKRLVGPSPEEEAASKSRLEALDRLSHACDWGNVAPSQEAQQARERWQQIMAEQTEFENAYL